jgi:hypothetical protein
MTGKGSVVIALYWFQPKAEVTGVLLRWYRLDCRRQINESRQAEIISNFS